MTFRGTLDLTRVQRFLIVSRLPKPGKAAPARGCSLKWGRVQGSYKGCPYTHGLKKRWSRKEGWPCTWMTAMRELYLDGVSNYPARGNAVYS